MTLLLVFVCVCACASALRAADREALGSPRPGTAPCMLAGSARRGHRPCGWHAGAAGPITVPPPMAGAPRQYRATTMFQRKRSVSFGGYGWWVPFLSIPALLPGARCRRRSFSSLCVFKGGSTTVLRRGALAAEPFPLPHANRSVWESGRTSFPPVPVGKPSTASAGGCCCAPAKPLVIPAGAKQ